MDHGFISQGYIVENIRI